MRTLALAVLALAACEGPAPPRELPGQASLKLGTSDANQGFVPYTDGEDVTLVQGAQGGFHVWMRYAFDGASGGSALLERKARRASDGALVLRSTADVTLERESAPLPMFMCPSPAGLSVIDQPIEFELRFSTGDGELADERITLVPHCPDENQDFCLRICTG